MIGHRVVIVKPSQIELETYDPPPLKDHDVLLRTQVSLISPGTERAFFLALPNTNATYPLYPGYSNIGEVVQVGSAVEHLKVGDRVACTAQHASHVVIEAARCLVVPSEVPNEHAVFFNLVAIAMQGVRKAHIELGEPIIVIGSGPIGLFALQLAKLNGGLPVIALDQDANRLQIARAVGADASGDDALGQLSSGASVVIEVTGSSAGILRAFQLAAFRGRVVLLGSTRSETDGVNFYRDIHRKGLTIVGAHEITRPRHESLHGWWTQHDEQQLSLQLMASDRLKVQPLISHRFGWEQFPAAYQLLADWDPSVMGMVMQW